MKLTYKILPIIAVSAAPMALRAAEADSIPYGLQQLEAAFGYSESRDSYTVPSLR